MIKRKESLRRSKQCNVRTIIDCKATHLNQLLRTWLEQRWHTFWLHDGAIIQGDRLSMDLPCMLVKLNFPWAKPQWTLKEASTYFRIILLSVQIS